MNTFLTRISIIALSAGLLLTGCSEEEGCTDPSATNYDAVAEKDCCCEYDSSSDNLLVSAAISTNTEWTNDNIYELDGRVWVEAGATLTIQAGTIVKGGQGDGSDASALIIARGAQLIADGTASQPIIFTSVLDNIALGELQGDNLNEFDKGKWGGLIVLGKATISAENGDDEAQIEGIPADQPYGAYGGGSAADDADNSGILRYLSIRHGGVLIGEGNEINGLTLGGVGSGTVIDHIEVVGNVDDGVEFFGGTVNATNVIVAFQGDDGIDIDQNYDGTVDNFLVVHGVDTDEGLEIDGPEGTASGGTFTLRNGTVLSTDGTGSAADLKSKAQGLIEGVHFSGYSADKYIKVRESYADNCTSEKTDSYDYYTNGSNALVIIDSEFDGTTGLMKVYTSSDSDDLDANGENIACDLAAGAQATAQGVFNVGGHLTGAATATIGADLSAFDNWSWSSLNNKY